jgi:SAM-dependent methyltransferase
MIDEHYTAPDLAALYDMLCRNDERGDFRFYLPMVLAASSVLDVGCGTGALLKAARRAGHRGRLCGIDPAPAMLAWARDLSDVEWVLGDLDDSTFDADFDLVVMSGNAFQALVDDHPLRATLAGIAAALVPSGLFVFESRNPDAREWETWAAHPVEVLDAEGRMVRMERRVEVVREGLVSFAFTFTRSGWSAPRQSPSTIRFHDAREITALLAAGGLEVIEQFGDWERDRPIAGSLEVVTVARRSRSHVEGRDNTAMEPPIGA